MEDSAVLRLLQEERRINLGRIASLTLDLEEIIESSAGSNADDEHDPEGSTVAFERAQVSARLTEARSAVDQLDQALVRLANGDYWLCANCEKPIGPERLAARPSTTLCMSCVGLGGHHSLA
jgi:DnaK suppressor protein